MGNKRGTYQPDPDKQLGTPVWSERCPMVFRPAYKGRESEFAEMMEYLDGRGAKPREYIVPRTGERVLRAITISRKADEKAYERMGQRAEERGFSMGKWLPREDLKTGSLFEQNITWIKFQDIIGGKILDKNTQYHLYIVRKDDLIFYVGQAAHAGFRLCGRLNPYRYSTDELAKLMRRHLQDALSWGIGLPSLEDCEALVVEVYRLLAPETSVSEIIEKYRTGTFWNVDAAENALIWLFLPYLNDRFNPFAAPLPPEYLDNEP
jgi:hypothetical protein